MLKEKIQDGRLTSCFRKVSQYETVCFLITGYNQVITSMNRAIPIAIALYRYCCVFHDATLRDPSKKQIFQQSLLSLIIGIPIFSLVTFARFPTAFQRFLECSGKEEVFKYDLDDFYHVKSLGPLTNLETFSISRYFHAKLQVPQIKMFKSLLPRIMLQSVYLLYIFVVPFCYTRIYIFRRNHIKPGSGKRHQERVEIQRRRNHVTFSYNMIIWIIEATCTIIVGLREMQTLEVQFCFILGSGNWSVSQK